MTLDGETPRETGPLARFTSRFLRAGVAYFALLLCLSVYNHGRWTHASSMFAAYGLPIAGALFLWIVSRASISIRVITLLVIVPLILALLAIDLYVGVPGRIVRTWGFHSIVERQRGVVVADMRRRGVDAYPWVAPAEFQYGRPMRRIGADSILPLGSISEKHTVLCAEGDLVVSFDADEHGFNNPRGLWKPDSVDVALIGDSFVLGSCLPPAEHFVSFVRQAFPRTLSTGGLGNGPLSELAILREFVAPMHPRRVLWFFFEGNDMEDLAQESGSPLSRYLDHSFSQRLLARQSESDEALTAYADSAVRATPRRPIADRLRNLLMLRDLRMALGFEAGAAEREQGPDYVTLSKVLAEANATVTEYGGTLTLVYLPEQHRLDHSSRQPIGRHHDEDDIKAHTLSIARELGLPVIDVSEAFALDKNPKALWWRPRTHLSPYGNRQLAGVLLKSLR